MSAISSGLDVFSWRTLVLRSKVSFSWRCFPDLLARSIHFPLNHLMVGFFSRDSAFTLATNVMFSPGHDKSSNFFWSCLVWNRFCEVVRSVRVLTDMIQNVLTFIEVTQLQQSVNGSPTVTSPLWGFSVKSPVRSCLVSGAWPSGSRGSWTTCHELQFMSQLWVDLHGTFLSLIYDCMAIWYHHL